MSLRGLFETIYLASALLLAGKQEPPFGPTVTLPEQKPLPVQVREALVALRPEQPMSHVEGASLVEEDARLADLYLAPVCSASAREGAGGAGSVVVAAVAVDAVRMAVR